MSRNLKYIISLLVLLTALSCSTKRNTAVTRFYHNLTSYYNILFNGKESFKSGIQKLLDTYEDNFTEILPVFLYTDKNALSVVGAEMDRTIKKSTKLISMHSLTAKPKVKPDKELSLKQKEFFGRKEYNRYVDEAYLLMGKAHFYKMEFGQAKETFNYINSNYPDDVTVNETRIWLARLAIEEGRYREAEDIMNSLSQNLGFPKHLSGQLFATWADYFIKQKQYDQSIEYLLKTIDNTRGKRLRTRYTYILAQIYAETGNFNKASEYYGRVISMNPPYEMTFNAKINQALTYQAGTSSRKDIEKQLQKMLKDDKNIEYQDQIYYALGNLYFKDKMEEKAIENYRLSIKSSTNNNRQKAKSNLTLADLYYEKPDYILAQAYYDSALTVIESDYPNYEAIHTKSISLTKLVENIRTVEFEDSVLKLSAMPEPELLAFIDKLIEDEARAEEERKRMEEQLNQERLDNMGLVNTLAQADQGGKWYFYNTTAKDLGRKEFFQSWGNRKLEDNWRRKNKTTVDFNEQPEEVEGEEKVVINEAGLVTNKRTREFYTQYIPFTDSAKKISLGKISDGLYSMGNIYVDELKDYPDAVTSYEELLRRFPGFDNRLHVYYKLYNTAKLMKDIDRVNKYQQKIIREFPNSNFSRLMTNPDYIQQIQNEEKKLFNEYDQILGLFNLGRHAQVIPMVEKMITENPAHELRPKLDYMHTVSTGLGGDTLAFITNLKKLINKYPATDIAKNAQHMIDYMESESPEVVQQINLQEAREIYTPSPDESHFFMFVVPVELNINQLIFNIVNFNLDNYEKQRLEVKRVPVEGKKSLCVVQSFSNAGEASSYLQKISIDPGIFRDVKQEGTTPVIISRTNFNKLKETNKTDEYILFFKANY